MKYLNLGAGYPRPLDTLWTNVDLLSDRFGPDTDDWKNAMEEGNFIDCDLRKTPWPFENESYDGILASHILEHMNIQENLVFMRECWRVLKPGGKIRIVVPDASKLLSDLEKGVPNTSYGEWCPPEHSFMEYVLFFVEHKQIHTLESISALLIVTDFKEVHLCDFQHSSAPRLSELDNRKLFSLFMEATK